MRPFYFQGMYMGGWLESKESGFTLLELLMAIVILALLGSISFSTYMSYSIRSRVNEGIQLSSVARAHISEAASAVQELSLIVVQWNSQADNLGASSKYVSSVLMTPRGHIVVSFSSAAGVNSTSNTLVYSPYIRSSLGKSTDLATALSNNISGTLDWACASSSAVAAVNNGMPSPMLGTLIPEYAPSYCR